MSIHSDKQIYGIRKNYFTKNKNLESKEKGAVLRLLMCIFLSVLF